MNLAPQRMTPSEALVETMVANGVRDVFGIVGSAYMDALDLFPAAGIRFVSVAHEQGAAHMADGYARASGRQMPAPARLQIRRNRPFFPILAASPGCGREYCRSAELQAL